VGFCGGIFVVGLLWWDFCGGIFVVGFLWWDFCGGIFFVGWICLAGPYPRIRLSRGCCSSNDPAYFQKFNFKRVRLWASRGPIRPTLGSEKLRWVGKGGVFGSHRGYIKIYIVVGNSKTSHVSTLFPFEHDRFGTLLRWSLEIHQKIRLTSTQSH